MRKEGRISLWSPNTFCKYGWPIFLNLFSLSAQFQGESLIHILLCSCLHFLSDAVFANIQSSGLKVLPNSLLSEVFFLVFLLGGHVKFVT